jgi:uncharacterized membrane protein YgcG
MRQPIPFTPGALWLTPRHPALRAQGRDSVSLMLCALTHGLTWSRAALLLFVLGGHLQTPPRAAGVAAFVCQWLITPFAYLYHEAVGVGYAWGASGVASRAAEAAAVLALLAVLLHGTLSLLSALSPAADTGTPPTGITASFFTGPADGAVADSSASPAIDRLLLLAGLVGTIVSFARGALHPLLPPADHPCPSHPLPHPAHHPLAPPSHHPLHFLAHPRSCSSCSAHSGSNTHPAAPLPGDASWGDKPWTAAGETGSNGSGGWSLGGGARGGSGSDNGGVGPSSASGEAGLPHAYASDATLSLPTTSGLTAAPTAATWKGDKSWAAGGDAGNNGPHRWSSGTEAGRDYTCAAGATHSLLAEPLPTSQGVAAWLTSARHLSPRQALRLLASIAWAALWMSFILLVALHLMELIRLCMLALPLDPHAALPQVTVPMPAQLPSPMLPVSLLAPLPALPPAPAN